MRSIKTPTLLASLGLAVVGMLGTAAPGTAQAQLDVFGPQRLLETYCVGCHTTEQLQQGNVPIALDSVDLTNVGSNVDVWENVVRKLRAGLMPPSGMRRPDQASHDEFVAFLENALDRASEADPNPGRTEPLHRLNRAEYQNAIRDLLDLEVDVSALLPSDDASYGFDNIAGVLGMSPTLMERYLTAAQKISRMAVGTPPPFPSIDYFRVADDLLQDVHLTDMSLGTRGGTRIRYTFPMDAEYTIRVELTRDLNESLPFYREPQHLEISIDGKRVNLFTIDGLPTAPESIPEPEPEPPADNTDESADDVTDEPADPERSQISQIANRGPRLSREQRAAHNLADRGLGSADSGRGRHA
jgi:mono/diheme cytochrome c family protein